MDCGHSGRIREIRMKIDLEYTADTKEMVIVPFEFSGDTVSGARLLAQKVITLAFTDGDDPLRLFGGGLLAEIMGGNIHEDALERYKQIITIALKAVTAVLVESQMAQPELTPEETLSDVLLDDLQIIPDSTGMYLGITIVTLAGSETFNLGLKIRT